LHHLHTNLIIQNVHNISLIGSTTNGTTPDTVIQCGSSVGVVMTNITSLIMKSMVVKRCSAKHGLVKAAIVIKHCNFVKLTFLFIMQTDKRLSLIGVNILGHSQINNISCNAIYLCYIESNVKTSKNHVIILDHFNLVHSSGFNYGIHVSLEQQHTFKVTLQISNTVIHHLQRYNFLFVTSKSVTNQSKIIIHDCHVTNTIRRYKRTLIKLFRVINISAYFSKCSFFHNTVFKGVITAVNSIDLVVDHCTFYTNFVSILGWNDQGLITTKNVLNLQVLHCYFYNNTGEAIITNPHVQYIIPKTLITTAVIQNTTFYKSLIPPSAHLYLVDFSGTRLLLIGPVIFNNIDDGDGDGCIVALANSIVTVYHYVEFSHNNAFGIITYRCTVQLERCFIMNINDNAFLNITNNALETFFSVEVTIHSFQKSFYPPCFFQYLNSNNQTKTYHYAVVFSNNSYKKAQFPYHSLLHDFMNRIVLRFSIYHIHITHCYWLPQSVFNTTIPMEINKQVIQYTNNSGLNLIKDKTLCYCTNETQYDCFSRKNLVLYTLDKH